MSMPVADAPVARPADAPAPSHLREALERHLPEMLALGEDELLVISLDVMKATIAVRGAWPEISSYRAQVAKLPDFDMRSFDNLDSYAMATAQAYIDDAAEHQSPSDLPALAARGIELRELFNTDLKPLVRRGIVDADTLSELRMLVGYDNVSFDLLLLVNVIRQSWAAISSRASVTAAELAEAEQVADRLMTSPAKRAQGQNPGQAADRLLRAYTLFMNAYDDVQRAITFLRWKNVDADRIAPSLYAGRHHRKSEKQNASPVPAQGGSPASPSGGDKASPLPGGSTLPAGPKVPGGPGGNPFVG